MSNSPTTPSSGSLRVTPFRRLWHHLAQPRRKQFGLLLMLMILSSFAELVSIGAVLPFLSILTSPERVFEHSIAQPIIHVMGFTEPSQLLVPITIFFALAALFAGSIRLSLLWVSTRLSFATGADLGFKIYQHTLHQPYTVHVSRNSSEIIDAITVKTGDVISKVILPLVNSIASGIVLIVVLTALITYQPIIAFSIFGGIGLIYVLIFKVARSRLISNSHHIAYNSKERIKYLQEGMGGIRDLLIDGTQEAYCKTYREADLKLRLAQAENAFISASPRFLMEALGMVLIAGLALALVIQPGGIERAIPILGGLALGAQRLLPMLQQLYLGWTNIKGSQKSLLDTLDLLDQPLPGHFGQPPASLQPFLMSIHLKDVWFRYKSDAPWILQGVDLIIPRGSRVGIIGTTGSGKSTLLDILMGLLPPTRGNIIVDDVIIDDTNKRQWQAHIAHVPQTIFLADATIEENIAFGVAKTEIDSIRVHRAAEQAQIAATIEGWENGYQTIVGERGVRLSGGQRQRIGIARALYKQADVIILDEATSALDTATEHTIMKAIEKLDRSLTIFIIAHRLSTLEDCDSIVEMVGGVPIYKKMACPSHANN
jgi:ABC-type multidrug transport system fused ATPase/permease subunit